MILLRYDYNLVTLTQQINNTIIIVIYVLLMCAMNVDVFTYIECGPLNKMRN